MIHPGLVMFLISTFPAAVSDAMKDLFFLTPLERSKPEKNHLRAAKWREIRRAEKRADFSGFSAFPVMTDLASVQTVEVTSNTDDLDVAEMLLKSLHNVEIQESGCRVSASSSTPFFPMSR